MENKDPFLRVAILGALLLVGAMGMIVHLYA
jgi:preprotein translocase subunit Sss1